MLKEYWAKRRQANSESVAQGLVRILAKGQRLQVTCPDNDTFTRGALELGGRWRHKTQFWSFPIQRQRLVRELVIQCYGKDKVQ